MASPPPVRPPDDAWPAELVFGSGERVVALSKGDGETWEAYAHRLEARIKQQRDHIKHLIGLREPGDIHARRRIAVLERLLGKKEVQRRRRPAVWFASVAEAFADARKRGHRG